MIFFIVEAFEWNVWPKHFLLTEGWKEIITIDFIVCIPLVLFIVVIEINFESNGIYICSQQ